MDNDILLHQAAVNRARTSFHGQTSTREALERRMRMGLGLAIAHYCRWAGGHIMEIFSAALEDANLHCRSATVDEWIGELKE